MTVISILFTLYFMNLKGALSSFLVNKQVNNQHKSLKLAVCILEDLKTYENVFKLLIVGIHIFCLQRVFLLRCLY